MFHRNIANKRENPIKLIGHDGGFAFKAGETYFTFIVYNLIKNGFIILGVQFEFGT